MIITYFGRSLLLYFKLILIIKGILLLRFYYFYYAKSRTKWYPIYTKIKPTIRLIAK